MRRNLTFFVLILIATLAACGGNPTPTRPTPPPDVVSDSAVKILINEDGLYRVTLREMQQAGFSLSSLSDVPLTLLNGETEIPFVVDEDSITFYGQAINSRYTRTRPYILQTGGEQAPIESVAALGAEGEQVSSVWQTVRVESNWEYDQRAAEVGAEDVWFWHRLVSNGDNAIFDIEIDLPTIGEGEAELDVSFWGLTYPTDINPDHDVDVSINGTPLGTITFDGQEFYTGTLTLDATILQEGENTITLDNSVPGAAPVDQMWVNWAALRYPIATVPTDGLFEVKGVEGTVVAAGFDAEPQVWDVSEPNNAKLVTGAYADGAVTTGVISTTHLLMATDDGYRSATVSSLVETDLTDSDNQADLLIVTTRTLAPAMEPLVEAREAQGLTVRVAMMDELYDNFAGGLESPDAIVNFVRYTVDEWQDPDPRYVFLVGDATTDTLGNFANRPNNPIAQPQNYIPSMLVDVPAAGETVSDARLTDIDGDGKPNLAVGRWPVDSVREVENLVERTLAYEQAPPAGQSLFSWDESDQGGAEFSSFTERLLQNSEFPDETAQRMPGATADELTSRWQEGAWVVSYVGHGSLDLWGKDEVLSSSQVKNLGSEYAPPVVLQFTCLTGQFAYPADDSISEVMLKDDGGPVLLVASTSLTLSTHQSPFAEAFLTELLNPERERIGDVLQIAKIALLTENNSGIQEISDTFGLIGDPSALVVRP